MFKKLLYFIILVSVFSCSATLSQYFKKESETSQRNEQLMKSFKVDEDVLSKFKENQTDEVPKKEEQKAKNEKKSKINLKKTTKPIPKKKKIAKIKTKVKKKTQSPPKSPYPEDFPEEYIKKDNVSKTFWKKFKPVLIPNEEVYMDINYMGVSTGKISIKTKEETKIGDQDVYHLKAEVKTAKYYRYLYELDDNLDSYVTTDNFIPVKYSLIQRESGQNIDDLQLFDLKKMKTYTFYKRQTKKKTKKKKSVKDIPLYFQDPLSIIYFLRGLDMDKNQSYEVPIINKGRLIILKARLIKTETIKTKIGKMSAYKVKASTSYSGDTLKSGDMTFWFSNDDKKIFLKFKAKIKIGSISGDIEKYKH